jgi:hypothetical protein
MPHPTIQSFPWQASIEAVKASERFSDYADFHAYLLTNLPINSPETRQKYANVIQRRFFPGRTLSALAPLVWQKYQDEPLLADVMRVISLEAEPAVAEFIVSRVISQTPGAVLTSQDVRDFITTTYGAFKVDSFNRLRLICRDLGFLGRYGSDLIVERIPLPENAFLILLHDRLASTPRIVRLNEILDTLWWRYLGLRDPADVREILHRAEAAGLIARYVRVDELEQVTTRYSRDEYLQQALRL